MSVDIKTTVRSELCKALIAAGKTEANAIIGEVTTLERFIFSASTETVEPITFSIDQRTEEAVEKAIQTGSAANTEKTVSEEAAVTDGDAALNESAQQSFTADDVKSALMQVAKKSRSELQKILAHFNVANVSAIRPEQYAAVILMTEEVLGVADA